jgi:protein-tyrosine phosphatase
MADKTKRLHLDIEVDSAGFESFHRGDPADPRSINVASNHGIDLSDHTARMFSVVDFDCFDRIYVMDRNNYEDVMGLARNAQDKQKVDFILNLVTPGQNRQVPDPWYGGKDHFERTFLMLEQACGQLAQELLYIERNAKSTKP